MHAALASCGCLFDGHKLEDVCNLSTTSSSGPSTCCSGKRSAWSYWTAAAHATINSFGGKRTITRTKTPACTSWPWVWWPGYGPLSWNLFVKFDLWYQLFKLVHMQMPIWKAGFLSVIYCVSTALSILVQIMIPWGHWTPIILPQLLQWVRKR